MKISDPYAMLHSYELIYMTQVWVWTWFPFWGYWLWVPVWYGSDYYLYCRYIGEPSLEATYYWFEIRTWFVFEKMIHQQFIKYFTAAGMTFLLTGGPYGAIVAAILFAIAFDQWVVSEEWYEQSWQTFDALWEYNYAKDPSFGFMVMDRMHLLWDAPSWDPYSWAQYFWIDVDGLMVQSGPPGGGVMPIWESSYIGTLNAACLWFGANYGYDNWVWLGEWAP
nr:hypothetical protein [Candidatus Freyarchaeota archaeon]